MSLSLNLDDIFQAAALRLQRSELLRECGVLNVLVRFLGLGGEELVKVGQFLAIFGGVFFRDSSILGSGIIIQ